MYLSLCKYKKTLLSARSGLQSWVLISAIRSQIILFGLPLQQSFQMLTFGHGLVVTALKLANRLFFFLNGRSNSKKESKVKNWPKLTAALRPKYIGKSNLLTKDLLSHLVECLIFSVAKQTAIFIFGNKNEFGFGLKKLSSSCLAKIELRFGWILALFQINFCPHLAKIQWKEQSKL